MECVGGHDDPGPQFRKTMKNSDPPRTRLNRRRSRGQAVPIKCSAVEAFPAPPIPIAVAGAGLRATALPLPRRHESARRAAAQAHGSGGWPQGRASWVAAPVAFRVSIGSELVRKRRRPDVVTTAGAPGSASEGLADAPECPRWVRRALRTSPRAGPSPEARAACRCRAPPCCIHFSPTSPSTPFAQ